MHALHSLALALLLTLPAMGATPEEKLAQLGLTLPTPAPAVANYVPAVRTGNLVFLAGHLPRDAAGAVITGKLGEDITEEAAVEAARATALALLATLKAEIGELSRVRRVVRVGGFVNASPTYTRHPTIINGCSDLLVAVWGERGRHARAAVGAGSLPLNAAVEIELVVEIE
jgi:enamine deaminase RidA (YjgF/YER057c/UK114 family)